MSNNLRAWGCINKMSIFTIPKDELQCFSYEMIPDSKELEYAMDDTSSSLIRASPEIVKALQENHRAAYNRLSETINTNSLSFGRGVCKNRVITFKDALVSTIGTIITSHGIYHNGGCVKKDRAYTQEESAHIFMENRNQCRSYNKVVSIAALWAGGVWHFPMEALVALKCISSFK